MWCWYYDKRELRHTQSIQQGLSVEQEIQYRREGARFILQIGNKMGLRYETMATGVVYYHRFYMVHTFQEFPRHVTACCCLFLSGKVEETPKKCKDIMKTAKSLIDEETWAEFGPDPREEVMTLERILLQTIKFDFIVEHPYPYLLKFAKCLKGDKKKLHNMVQMAWTFVNDSLCTTLSLQWEPEIIAIALMYLAGKLSKFEVTDWSGRTSKHQRWWDIYVHGISMDLLEDICHQVLDLYSPKQTDGGGNIGGSSSSSSVGNINMAIFSGDTPGTGAVPGTRRTSDSVPSTPTGPPPAKKAKKEEVYCDPGKLAVDGAIRSWMKQEAANTGPGKQTVQNAIQQWMQKEGSDPVGDVVSQQAIPKFPLIAKGNPFQVTASPVKVPEVVSTVPAVPAAGNQAASASSSSSYPYPYPYPNYASGPHNYPPPSAAPPASSSGPPPRYPAPHPTYNYPPTSSTQVPPPQGPPQGPPPQQIPPSYQQPSGPPARQGYGVPPPTGGSSSGGPGPGPVPQYSRQPSAAASHQYPSSGHSSGSGYHQPPGSASHYPSGPPAPTSQAPPGSHYPPPSHGSSSSSYYPQPPNASQGQPPPYQQSESRSSYPSSYGHTGHSGHSSSRPYYPPS